MEEKNAAIELFEEWGAVKALRRTLLNLGRQKLGDLTPEQETVFRAIDDPDRLERMAGQLLAAKDWETILKVK